jgi:phenylalanyl-tRNA synthetase beta chain
MKSVFSPPGTFIPGKNITLGKVGTIRGVESRGMLCSAPSSNSPTIMTASSTCRPTRRRQVPLCRLGRALGDPVIEINLTPNRPDCTGVHGIARDLAAAGLGKLKSEPPSSR